MMSVIYEGLIKGAGIKKIIQKDSVSSMQFLLYMNSTYKHLGNMFDIQKEQLALKNI